MGIKVAHVEAGLRSGDRTMPEEINRLVTDAIADLLLTPSEDGSENLRREGVPEEKIRLVGNIMIDSMVAQLDEQRRSLNAQFLQSTDSVEALRLHNEVAALTEQLAEVEGRWCRLQEEIEGMAR